MGLLDRLMFWRKPAQPEYEITDCFGEPTSTDRSVHSVNAAGTEDAVADDSTPEQ